MKDEDTIPREFEKGLPNTTKEEMNAVAALAHSGDTEARHRLGEMMQPFVIGYIRNIKGDYTRHMRDEITQAAWLGVAVAVDKWDDTNDVRFSTYAYWWIRGEVNHWLSHNSGVIAIPRPAWADLGHIERHVRNTYGDDTAATELTDDELSEVKIGNTDRRFRSAGAAFRARQQAFDPDPNWEPNATLSAEDIYFRDEHDLEDEALDVLALCRDHIANGNAWLAEETAATFTHKHGLPEEVIARLMETSNENSI